jgi:hypothetical protein
MMAFQTLLVEVLQKHRLTVLVWNVHLSTQKHLSFRVRKTAEA